MIGYNCWGDRSLSIPILGKTCPECASYSISTRKVQLLNCADGIDVHMTQIQKLKFLLKWHIRYLVELKQILDP